MLCAAGAVGESGFAAAATRRLSLCIISSRRRRFSSAAVSGAGLPAALLSCRKARADVASWEAAAFRLRCLLRSGSLASEEEVGDCALTPSSSREAEAGSGLCCAQEEASLGFVTHLLSAVSRELRSSSVRVVTVRCVSPLERKGADVFGRVFECRQQRVRRLLGCEQGRPGLHLPRRRSPRLSEPPAGLALFGACVRRPASSDAHCGGVCQGKGLRCS